MEHAVVEVGQLTEPQAVLVVEMARNMNELYGATDDYVVTREFGPERHAGAARGRCCARRSRWRRGDDSITPPRVAELNEIGKELGFRADEVDAIRDEFRDQLAALQAMRAARTG